MLADAYSDQLEGVWWEERSLQGSIVATYGQSESDGVVSISTDADGDACKVMALTAC
jgi:hypothetical protein